MGTELTCTVLVKSMAQKMSLECGQMLIQSSLSTVRQYAMTGTHQSTCQGIK